MKPAEGSTYLGKSFTVRGDITGSEDIFIDGAIEGTITLAESRLTVGPNGRVKADLQVQDAIVLGELEGNITAKGRLELRQTGVFLGNITAARLSVEESAVIRGNVLLTGKD